MRTLCGLGLVGMLVFVTAGCASNNKGKIEGTKWTSESALVKGKQLPSGAIFLDFRRNGTLLARYGSQTNTGTYSLGWGDLVTLHLEKSLVTGNNHTETVVIKEKRMTMTDPDGTSLTFRKWQ